MGKRTSRQELDLSLSLSLLFLSLPLKLSKISVVPRGLVVEATFCHWCQFIDSQDVARGLVGSVNKQDARVLVTDGDHLLYVGFCPTLK